jgi:outer membrane protein assembly factor BamB
MKVNCFFSTKALCILCVSGMLSSVVSLAGEYTRQAKEILEATSVKGGLIVHVGCGNGELTAALGAGGQYLVHGLDADIENIRKARRYIRAMGIYGQVSVDSFDGQRLPYADNLVSLVVAEDLHNNLISEVKRVLEPNGVAYIKESGDWKKIIKTRSEEIDEWTHYLYDAGGNAVSGDRIVGPPQHFQWISEPRFSRSHDHLSSVSTMVSSGGRLFYIVDTGSLAFAAASPKWRLIARDAFNGIKLWQREVSPWEYHLRDFRSGPADIARRLVAVGNRVYVTLGYGKPVTILDAATGENILTCAGTEGASEILYYKDTLLVVLGEPKEDWQAAKAKQIVSQTGYNPPFEDYTPPAHAKKVAAINASNGEILWKNSEPYTRELMPSTLAASDGRVYFQNPDTIICLDSKTGKLLWEAPRPIHRQRLAWSTPTLVAYDGLVFSADRRAAKQDGEILWIPSGGYHDYIRGNDVEGELITFDGKTGERLWKCPAYEGFNAPVDVMIADGLLWTGRYAWGADPGVTEGRDPRTGEIRRRRQSDQEFLSRIGHARCYRARATSEYLILGRRGVEFVDLETGNMVANFWVRGMCQFGVMPANGLLYIPPHSCACSVNDMLKCGFMALAPEYRKTEVRRQRSEELAKGPAYDSARWKMVERRDISNWPTYRHDASRSGVTSTDVSHDLQVLWETDLGSKSTSPVIADGVLLVAQTGTHCIHALDVASGRVRWSFVAGARIDSPPTIDSGRVLFGSADGCVYCLRLFDGEMVWKFSAAPQSRRIVVDEQLESPWPVSGSVLVVNGAAFFVAGRTSYLDGGMFLYKLDPATGEKLKMLQLEVEKEKRDGGIATGGYLPDILSADGDSIFLRSARFDTNLVRQKDDVAHLWSSVGFMEDNWWHRTYWQVGTSMASGWGGWAKAGQQVPAGRLLVVDSPYVFGFGRNQYDTPGAHVGIDADGVWGPIGREQGRWTFYRLFRQTMNTGARNGPRLEPDRKATTKPDWVQNIPILAKAMVLARETIFIAGPSVQVKEVPHKPSEVDSLAEALEAGHNGRLLAVSATDGKALANYDLRVSPVFDGMAAANGQLFISGIDGQIICMGQADHRQ